MSKPETGYGYLFEANGAFHTRFYIRTHGKRVKKSLRVCTKDSSHPSRESVIDLARDVVKNAQALNTDREVILKTSKCPTCGRYTKGAAKDHNAEAKELREN